MCSECSESVSLHMAIECTWQIGAICGFQGEMLTSPMATDDEDLARQQYESSGRKKGKKHKKDFFHHFRID